MDRKDIQSIDNNIDDSNDSNNSSADDKTYHFRKGSDLDGFESFGALFADGLFTDLAICCSGRVFRCHRVVMAASSAYIKNALSAFNAENSNNCNTIMILPQDIKVQDMEAILHFIYNGQVEVTRDAIESFLSSAKILHIKGLANIKLVYNNSNCNQNNHKINKNNKNLMNTSNNTSNEKSINNENQNSQNFNNNCINNENNNNTTSPTKKRNGIIGGQSTRSPKLKTDLNFNHFVDTIPQNQSFHSSQQPKQTQESDSKTSPSTARRKQRLPAKTLPTNGFIESPKDTNGNTNNWITIEDEEEAQELDNHLDSNDKSETKIDENETENEVEKSVVEETNGAIESLPSTPSMPCLIQIDADPTTFPSFCSETNSKSAKRRRSSSLRLEAKKNCGNSLVKLNRNGDPMKQMVRTSNRKLGFMSFHKKSSPTIWNSSNKWKCEICNKLYGNKQTLKEHMDYFHSNRAEQIFTCNICQKEYTWKKSLMKHYRDIHQMSNTSLSQLGASNHKSEDTSDPPALDWVTQSQDNSSQSK